MAKVKIVQIAISPAAELVVLDDKGRVWTCVRHIWELVDLPNEPEGANNE